MTPLTDISLQLAKFLPVFFFISITLFLGAGWLFGRYRIKKSGDSGIVVGDSLVTAIFGLSALVLGFTFSNAANHYETRVENIRAQANAIKEVYVSTQYLKQSDQASIKESLSKLLSHRLEAYSNFKSMKDIEIAIEKAAILVRQINVDVAKAVTNAPSENKALLFETLTIQTRNLVSTSNIGAIKIKTHPPPLMMRFLYVLMCVVSLLIGYTVAAKGENDWFLATIYVLMMGHGLYVILSLEYPNLLMPFEQINEDFLLLNNSLGSI